MKQPAIKLIIFLTALALTGLITTQVLWVRNALVAAKQHYDHRANLALDDVVDELQRMKQLGMGKFGKSTQSLVAKFNIMDMIDTTELRTLLIKYIDYHRLDKNFEFQIHRTSDDSVVYSSSKTLDFSKLESHKVCLSCLWEQQTYHLSVFFPKQWKFVILEMSLWLILSFVFIVIIIFIFAWIILAIVRQKKLSEIKNDFINNMTHEFKTPISTISLATEVLMNADPGTSMDRLQKYCHIIYDENQRLRFQVERVLQMAQLEKSEFHLKKSKTDLHQLIKDTVSNLHLDHTDKEVKVTFALEAAQPFVNVDTLHVGNVIGNLVDNAVKYSTRAPELHISTKSNGEGVFMEFLDNGIGISQEAQRRIFDRFYRVPTGDVHNVKGFGLGLYYVKTMVEAHGGTVNVSSELNKGSKFVVFLPFQNE